MRRTFAIVLAAAVVGGLAGASIGFAFDSGSGSETVLSVAETTASSSATGTSLTPQAIYRDAAPGVVVITDTHTETVPRTLFTPSRRKESALSARASSSMGEETSSPTITLSRARTTSASGSRAERGMRQRS